MLEKNEILSLKYRPDMRMLLRKLTKAKGKFVTEEVARTMLDASDKKYHGSEMPEYVSNALRGSTFVTLDDAIGMAKACKEECHALNVVVNKITGEREKGHFNASWPSVLVFCHDMTEWGSKFAKVAPLQLNFVIMTPSAGHCVLT